MAMQKLSVDLQCLISLSLQINNFKHVVEELVYNSLDAKATSIAVRINITENKIQVVDNGCGITESDFDLLGKKYSTSKCVDLNTLKSVPHTYGFRGQFLANLIKVAQKVKITSRFEKREDTWVKIFYNGKERDLAKTTTRPSVGTTVEVSALFYNLHIQSKIMESSNELSEIKTFLKQLTLVHSNISFSLRDDSNNEIIFKAHKNRNIYQTFGLLFNINEKDIVEFKVEKKKYKVTAYFGKKDKDVGQYHWIYLNGKFLNNCKLHKIVNDNLSKSCKHISNRKAKTKIYEEEDVFTKMNIPFYIILLSCPYYDYDINCLSKNTTLEFKNWQDITNLLKKLVTFYFGDDTLKKQTKQETVKNNFTRPKEDDVRDRVKEIVEKLLKSNSRKLGVSQMQNGIKGKLTKRKKKTKTSLNISLSRVIPSKNKMIRNKNELPNKNKSKEDCSNDEIVPDSNIILNVITKNEEKESKTKVKKKQIDNHNSNNLSKLSLEDIENDSDKQVKDHSNTKSKNAKLTKKNKYNLGVNRQFENCRQLEYLKGFRKSNILGDDSVKSIGSCKNMKVIDNNIIKNRNKRTNYHYAREKFINKNDVTNIYNVKDKNKQITIRENVEEIIVYDYIPHPLNSTQNFSRYQNKFTKKPHISSRELVKTILNTQHNNFSTKKDTSLHHAEEHEPKKSEMSFDFANVFTTSPNIEQNAKTKFKNTCDFTFNALNSDLQVDSNIINKVKNDDMFVSKMTFESHHYNKNICYDNKYKMKSKKFISKHSKENFIVSIEKQKTKKWHKNKLKYLPKIYFRDVDMSFGIKSFFKNKNFKQESFLIEFSNTKSKDDSHEATYLKNSTTDNYLFNTNLNKWMQISNVENKIAKQYTVNSEIQNTYTLSDCNSNTGDAYNMSCQNYESIKYTENIIPGTYTIETQNDKDLFYSENYVEVNNDGDIEVDAKNNKDGLNVVFVSEPQIEIAETDKIIEPIDICETILNDSNSSKPLSNIKTDFNHDIAQERPGTRQENYIESPKVSQREISHHFYTSINNTDYTTAPNVHVSNIALTTTKDNNYVDINNISNSNSKNINVKSTTLKDRYNGGINQEVPEDPISNNFNIKIRPRYMPKGMSQIFKNSNTKEVCDYKLDEEYYKCNIFKNFTKQIQLNTEIFKPTIYNATEDTTKAIEKVNSRLHKQNSLLTFDGQLLKQAQILNQVDGKFIAAIVKSKSASEDFLVLFDQHAVHERIRLENNISDYFNHQKWKSVKLDVFVLKLSKDEILYLHNYKDKFTQLGLEWNILSDYEVTVNSIPEAILGKNPRQVGKVITAVRNLILEEIGVIKSQGGCISLHPKSIMDLVFSEACRYAIKFGDKLTTNDCRELIQSLSDCKTPFQCAHGRPVMAVLMEMTSRDVPEYKIDVSKIRLFSENRR